MPLLLGGLFGIGLVLAGMTDPAYIRGFLDVTGGWRPELAFVMASALVISTLFFQLIQPKMVRPLFAEGFSMPTASQIDGRLIGGAFLFGMGWQCPGIAQGPELPVLPTWSRRRLALWVRCWWGSSWRIGLPQ